MCKAAQILLVCFVSVCGVAIGQQDGYERIREKKQAVDSYHALASELEKEFRTSKRVLLETLDQGRGLREQLEVVPEQAKKLNGIVQRFSKLIEFEVKSLGEIKKSREAGAITSEDFEEKLTEMLLKFDVESVAYLEEVNEILLPHQVELYQQFAMRLALRKLTQLPVAIELPCAMGKVLGIEGKRFDELVELTIEVRNDMYSEMESIERSFRDLDVSGDALRKGLEDEVRSALFRLETTEMNTFIKNHTDQIRLPKEGDTPKQRSSSEIKKLCKESLRGVADYKAEFFKTRFSDMPELGFPPSEDWLDDTQLAKIADANAVFSESVAQLEAKYEQIWSELDEKSDFDDYKSEMREQQFALQLAFNLTCESALSQQQASELQYAASSRVVENMMSTTYPRFANPLVAYALLGGANGLKDSELDAIIEQVRRIGEVRQTHVERIRDQVNKMNSRASEKLMSFLTDSEVKEFELLTGRSLRDQLNLDAFASSR